MDMQHIFAVATEQDKRLHISRREQRRKELFEAYTTRNERHEALLVDFNAGASLGGLLRVLGSTVSTLRAYNSYFTYSKQLSRSWEEIAALPDGAAVAQVLRGRIRMARLHDTLLADLSPAPVS